MFYLHFYQVDIIDCKTQAVSVVLPFNRELGGSISSLIGGCALFLCSQLFWERIGLACASICSFELWPLKD